ncbi:MAG: nitrogenase component 1 [Pseudomonadota bacterium]
MKKKTAEQKLDRFTPRVNFPYFVGVYLAVNAIEDAYLLVDGPDCAFLKGLRIQGLHDLGSTLFDAEGSHRIVFTGSKGREGDEEARATVTGLVGEIGRQQGCGVVLVSSLTPCAWPEERVSGNANVIHVPGQSLEGDWLDGYGRVLSSLAQTVRPAGDAPADPDSVGIVGYFMDRREADHAAGIGELRTMLAALSLNTVSVWLDGGPVRDLERIGEAAAVISLPYARDAARRIAARTGARLIETDLPVGIEGTLKWIREVAAWFGREQAAETFIGSRLSSIIPKLEWVVPQVFLNRSFYVSADPFLAAGLCDMIREFGGRVAGCTVTAREGHMAAIKGEFSDLSFTMVFEPRESELRREHKKVEGGGADLFVGGSELSGFFKDAAGCVELGFPSITRHAIFASPLLGLRGCLFLVQRIADEMMRRGCMHDSGGSKGPGLES